MGAAPSLLLSPPRVARPTGVTLPASPATSTAVTRSRTLRISLCLHPGSTAPIVPSAAESGKPPSGRRDVVVAPEQVLGIPRALDLAQPVELRLPAERGELARLGD